MNFKLIYIVFLCIFFNVNSYSQSSSFIDKLYLKLGFSVGTNVAILDKDKLIAREVFEKTENAKLLKVEKYNYVYQYKGVSDSILNISTVLIGVNDKKEIINIFLSIPPQKEGSLEQIFGEPLSVVRLPNTNNQDSDLKVWKYKEYCVCYFSSKKSTEELIIYNCNGLEIFKIPKN